MTLPLSLAVVATLLCGLAYAHENAWTKKYGELPTPMFAGVNTFAHLPWARCLETEDRFDIAVIGMPFDGKVSYRPGARFGPNAIRQSSRRQSPPFTWSISHEFDPYSTGLKLMDCDDVPTNPYDVDLALDQMEVAYDTLLSRTPAFTSREENFSETQKDIAFAFSSASLAKDGQPHPKLVTLGGDHTIVLPILRSLHKVYGPITVIHFDAHLDTWLPGSSPGSGLTEAAALTHGTFFHHAAAEGLIANSSVHGGIRCRLKGLEDIQHDAEVGFQIITADDLDDLGADGVAAKIKQRVGDRPVYLSLDIDVLDPAFAPATGTIEVGGWTSREMKRVLRGLVGLNFVGFDIVELSPAYDHAEITGHAAADLIFEFLNLLGKGNTKAASVDKVDPSFVQQSGRTHSEL